jgi:sialic acid synthase SpsE
MKVKVIAEIGSNWEGKLSIAKKIIQECKNAGAYGVKFQMWRAHDLYSNDHPNWKDIKKSELTFKKAKELKKFSDEIGINFICSAFYPEAVDFLESIGVKLYKVASRTCLLKDPHSKETLEAIAHTKKPVIISMGMGGDINNIKKIFRKNKTVFCFCISEYPLKFSKINWKKAVEFDGFSDHTLGITSPIIYTTLKNLRGDKEIIIEKHVKLNNSKGPDASTSINVQELADLITHTKLIEKAKLN